MQARVRFAHKAACPAVGGEKNPADALTAPSPEGKQMKHPLITNFPRGSKARHRPAGSAFEDQ